MALTMLLLIHHANHILSLTFTSMVYWQLVLPPGFKQYLYLLDHILHWLKIDSIALSIKIPTRFADWEFFSTKSTCDASNSLTISLHINDHQCGVLGSERSIMRPVIRLSADLSFKRIACHGGHFLWDYTPSFRFQRALDSFLTLRFNVIACSRIAATIWKIRP